MQSRPSRTKVNSRKGTLAQAKHESTWDYVGQHTFGSHLKRQRSTRGYSRHSLSITTGIQERRLMDIELGKEPPGINDIRALSTVLDIPQSELLVIAGYIKSE